MATETVDGCALMTIRTARKRHWCGEGRHAIEPGERYEDWRVPPGRGGNESDRWWRGKRHADEGREFGRACDEAFIAARERAFGRVTVATDTGEAGSRQHGPEHRPVPGPSSP